MSKRLLLEVKVSVIDVKETVRDFKVIDLRTLGFRSDSDRSQSDRFRCQKDSIMCESHSDSKICQGDFKVTKPAP